MASEFTCSVEIDSKVLGPKMECFEADQDSGVYWMRIWNPDPDPVLLFKTFLSIDFFRWENLKITKYFI